jgi:uncharacterized damage-inducible protein DinB
MSALSRDLSALIEGWQHHQELLVDMIAPLSDEQLRLSVAPGEWAIWQIAGHIAGGRAYWICDVLQESGFADLRESMRVAETTVPGLPLEHAGWEDDERHPRTVAELVGALAATWAMVRECAERWAPSLLHEGHPRLDPGETRFWVLWHLIEHDVHHGGAISAILGANELKGLEI